MRVREYIEEDDYAMLEKWWRGHNFEPVNKGILKPLGIIVSDGGKDCLAGWIYPVAGCGLAIMEWIVSNPQASPIAVYKSLNKITDFFGKWCLDSGYNVMVTTCKQRSLAAMHERNGFMETDRGMVHLVKILGGES